MDFNPDIGKDTQFSSDRQPAKRGRRTSLINRLKEALGDDELKPALTKKNVTDLIMMLFELETEKLQELAETKGLPVIVHLVISAILKGGKEGNVKVLLDIFARSYGLPKQEIDIEQNSTNTNVNIYIPDNGRK